MAVSVDEPEFVQRIGFKAGNENFPNTAGNALSHGMLTTVPLIKVTHDADRLSVGGPDRKVHAFHTVDGSQVRAQFFVDVEMIALVKQVQIHVRQKGFEIVRIVFGHSCVFLSVANLVSLVLAA